MKKIILYLQILWELPQFLVGLVLLIYYKKRIVLVESIKNTTIIRLNNYYKGISLGKIIIIGERASEITKQHELGHSKQSLWLGPLYLMVIGIPSLIHNIIHTQFGRKWNYYSFYTERWADKIVNIKR